MNPLNSRVMKLRQKRLLDSNSASLWKDFRLKKQVICKFRAFDKIPRNHCKMRHYMAKQGDQKQ